MTDKKTPKPEDLTEAELDKVAGGGKLVGDDIGITFKKDGKTKGVTVGPGGTGW